MRSDAVRQIVIGLSIAGVGGLISLASYQAASESGGGGYVVFWGAVVFGLLKAFRGVRLYLASAPDFTAVVRSSTSTPPEWAPVARPAPTPQADDLSARIKLGPARQGGTRTEIEG